MNFLSKGLRSKMVSILAVALVLMVAIAIFATVIVSNNIAEDVINDTVPHISESVSTAIINKINNTIDFLKIAKEDSTISSTNLEFEDKLGTLKSISAGESFDRFLSYGVVNKQGQGGTRSGATYDMTTRAFWADVQQNKTTVSEPLFGKTSQKWSYIMAVPYQSGGAFAGAVYGSIDISELADALSVAIINDHTSAYVVNDEGKIMISVDSADIENEANLLEMMAEQTNNSGSKKLASLVAGESEIETVKVGGKDKIVTSIPLTIGDTAWHMLIFLEKGDFTSKLGGNVFLVAVILIAICVVIMLASSVILGWILKPFVKITNRIDDQRAEIMGASQVINSSSGSLADSSKDQAASIEQISASIEETTSMIEQSAEGARNSKDLTAKAREMASVGNEKMLDMSQTIDEIKKSSDEIGKIINVIDDIASQTNILALNAAVEAARAGDAGKGFAVVAEEVRNLAQKSADAAKSTQLIIEKNLKFAEQGVEVSKEVAEAIETITDAIEKISVIAAETANAANEEAIGVSQVSEAVKNVEKASQATADNADNTSSASRNLDDKARELDEIVHELKKLING
ncbi:MAG: methyl-accepting chemotaxis protein [Clostridia bacterium]|nr:methyl-accepting chemotaxis protein [Clostridia bacterium]